MPSEEAIEQDKESAAPAAAAIPFPIDRCIEKDKEAMKELIKQYGSPQMYEDGEYTYFAFACVPDFSSVKYGKVKKVKQSSYYIQIRNQKQEVIEELIDYLALDDMIITEPDGKVILVIRYIKGDN